MKQKPRRLVQPTGIDTRPASAELSMLSTTELAETWQLRLQGGYFGNVDRRGFMN